MNITTELTNIIYQSLLECNDTTYDALALIPKIVDDILGQGTFIPVRVGQEVYAISHLTMPPHITIDYVNRVGKTRTTTIVYCERLGSYDIKDIFLSREAAEQALKEREKYGYLGESML